MRPNEDRRRSTRPGGASPAETRGRGDPRRPGRGSARRTIRTPDEGMARGRSRGVSMRSDDVGPRRDAAVLFDEQRTDEGVLAGAVARRHHRESVHEGITARRDAAAESPAPRDRGRVRDDAAIERGGRRIGRLPVRRPHEVVVFVDGERDVVEDRALQCGSGGDEDGGRRDASRPPRERPAAAVRGPGP